MAMLLEQTGHEASGQKVLDAIQVVTGTKMESQAAGTRALASTENPQCSTMWPDQYGRTTEVPPIPTD